MSPTLTPAPAAPLTAVPFSFLFLKSLDVLKLDYAT